MDRYFNEKELQMASKHIQRCSTSWAVIKMQIKTTMKSQYEPIWMVKIKKKKVIKPNADESMEKLLAMKGWTPLFDVWLLTTFNLHSFVPEAYFLISKVYTAVAYQTSFRVVCLIQCWFWFWLKHQYTQLKTPFPSFPFR